MIQFSLEFSSQPFKFCVFSSLDLIKLKFDRSFLSYTRSNKSVKKNIINLMEQVDWWKNGSK
jgi:hypothetical protein